MRGCDYSFSRPDPACLKRNGYHFAFRYLGRDSRGGKDLTKVEADRLIAAGLKVAVVCQPRRAFVPIVDDSGSALARMAHQDAVACGMPPTRPICFSVDGDTRGMSSVRLGVIINFFRQVNGILSVGRTGVYGGRHICEILRAAGVVNIIWQTVAWSDRIWLPYAHVRQGFFTSTGVGGMNISACNGTIDTDDSMVPDFGQWPLPTPPAATTPAGAALLLL